MGFTTKYLNKYYYSVTNQLIGTDFKGGLFLSTPDKKETIFYLNKDYNLIKEITIEGLYKKVQFEGNFGFPKHQSIYNISFINDHLFVSLQDNITCICDLDGKIINTLKVYKPEGNQSFENPNTTLRCVYRQLSDGRIITLAHSKFHGNQIAISKETNPDYLTKEIIDSHILTNTYTLPNNYMCPIFNNKDILSHQTIGEVLKNKRDEYWADQSSEKEFIKHLENARVWDMVQLDDNHILLFLYTNLSSKSNSPDKNIPYYFCKLNIETGEIIKLISPSDRKIYTLNLFPKFIKNKGRILFKTTEALYEIKSDLEIGELLLFKQRHPFKKLFPVISDYISNHFIIPDKAELFSYNNLENLDSNIEELVKVYKTEKKEYNKEKII